jgi:hypothetical protein
MGVLMADNRLSTSSFQSALDTNSAKCSQNLLASLSTTLRNMDFEYEREREKIQSSTPNPSLTAKALERLRELHLERREPYLRQVAILQQRHLGQPEHL